MTELAKLKALAEAAVDQHNRWVAAGSPWPMWNTSLLAMQAVVTPDALLILMADYERVTNNRDMWKGQAERQSEMLRLAHEADKQLKAECEGLRKDAELHAQIQRAAGELPAGWEIRVCVEHEAGYVELWDQDGCEVDFPNSCETLALTVSDAIDHATGKEASNG